MPPKTCAQTKAEKVSSSANQNRPSVIRWNPFHSSVTSPAIDPEDAIGSASTSLGVMKVHSLLILLNICFFAAPYEMLGGQDSNLCLCLQEWNTFHSNIGNFTTIIYFDCL